VHLSIGSHVSAGTIGIFQSIRSNFWIENSSVFPMGLSIGGGKLKPAIHITWSGSGKMLGKTSINDDPYSNEYCRTECANREVCYAKRFCRIYKNVGPAFKKNGDVMSQTVLSDQDIPRFSQGDTVRLHSYGEYRNEQHLENHILIARANPKTKFVGWSHRKDLISAATLPDNMVFIYSAAVDDIDPDIPDNFVGAYVPVKDETAKELHLPVLCKGQTCVSCGHCYNRAFVGVVYAKFKPISVPA
jgi:hypothetical protein